MSSTQGSGSVKAGGGDDETVSTDGSVENSDSTSAKVGIICIYITMIVCPMRVGRTHATLHLRSMATN